MQYITVSGEDITSVYDDTKGPVRGKETLVA